MRTFVFKDAKSNKFWNIELHETNFVVSSGRVGTAGKAHTEVFADAASAQKQHDKLIAEKLKEGYVETSGAAPAPAPPTSTEQQALEAALVTHPDEVAAHSAYADYLIEAGDPRGEFVQVQLALEDAKRPRTERSALKKREAALLKKHAREWLGDAGRFLVGKWSGEDKPFHFRFARGWLDYVRALPVPEALIAAVAKAPEARLLRQLDIIYEMRYHPFSHDQFTRGPEQQMRGGERAGDTFEGYSALPLLAESPYLTNLRVLKYGFSDRHNEGPGHSTMITPLGTNSAELLLDVLKACPRLEELHLNIDISSAGELLSSPLLGNLRVLQYYYGSTYRSFGQDRSDPYPLSALAENPALSRLKTLRLHPGRDAEIDIDELDALLKSNNLPALTHLQVHMTSYGDAGVERIIASGILKRLEVLDIGYGNMTDAGAQALAAYPDSKNLKLLVVSRNCLTSAGVDALRAAGVRVLADSQHADDDREYLYGVDWE